MATKATAKKVEVAPQPVAKKATTQIKVCNFLVSKKR